MTILHAQAAVCSQDRPHAAQAPCRRQAPSKSLLAVKVNPELPEAAQTRGCESGAHVYQELAGSQGQSRDAGGSPDQGL